MNILIVGSGGREHALAWKIAQSPLVSKLYFAPGNAGIETIAQCVDISAEDIPALRDFALKAEIGLTVVGPELPLTLGIVDRFTESGLDEVGLVADLRDDERIAMIGDGASRLEADDR